MQRIDQIRTLLLSYDDWVTTDYLLQVCLPFSTRNFIQYSLQAYKDNIGSSWSQTGGKRGTFIKVTSSFVTHHPILFQSFYVVIRKYSKSTIDVFD